MYTFPLKYADNRNGMFSSEFRQVLMQVIQSWQVLAVTIALVLYIILVRYVGRTHHRPRISKSKPKSKQKKEKVKKEVKPEKNPDELVLEE